MRDLSRRGFAVHALSLRGHGASDMPARFNMSGIDDYLRDIEAALARIEPAPIVVAHSMGGFLLQHLMARRSLPGVVLLCAIPHTGSLRFLLAWARRHPVATLRSLATGNTRHVVGSVSLAREAFFRPDLPDAEAATYAACLVPEAVRVAVATCVNRPRITRGRTPVLVVAAERDAVFTLAEQRAMAAAYGAELVVVQEAAHDLMLDPAWPQAADQIERVAACWSGEPELVGGSRP